MCINYGGDGEIRTLAGFLDPYRFSRADPSATWVHLHKAGLLYQPSFKKSRFFRQLQHHGHFFHDLVVIAPAMGLQAIGAILNAIGQIPECAAALVTQGIKGAIAEQAIKILRVRALMAGEIFTFPVLKEIVITHRIPSIY